MSELERIQQWPVTAGRTTSEVRQLENRVAELEEALGELWFSCGEFWDGDDSIKRLLRQVKTKGSKEVIDAT